MGNNGKIEDMNKARLIVTRIQVLPDGRQISVLMSTKHKGKRICAEEIAYMDEKEVVPRMMMRLYYNLKGQAK